jgi:hypothetical protein
MRTPLFRSTASRRSRIRVSAISALLTNANFRRLHRRRLLRSSTIRQCRDASCKYGGSLRVRRTSREDIRLGPIRDDHKLVSIRSVIASLFPHCQVPKGAPHCGSDLAHSFRIRCAGPSRVDHTAPSITARCRSWSEQCVLLLQGLLPFYHYSSTVTNAQVHYRHCTDRSVADRLTISSMCPLSSIYDRLVASRGLEQKK